MAEAAYFMKWFEEQSYHIQQVVRQLVNSGNFLFFQILNRSEAVFRLLANRAVNAVRWCTSGKPKALTIYQSRFSFAHLTFFFSIYFGTVNLFSGQLEFVNGAYSMNDEASTFYKDIIDDFTIGKL